MGALRVWAQDPRIIPQLKGSERATAVAHTLSDPLFLPKITELETIIHPISDAIIDAQHDHAHLACVRPRWEKLYQHLRLMERASTENWDNLWPILQARWSRQILDIHDLAFWLLPCNVRDRRQFLQGMCPLQLLILINTCTGEQTRVLRSLESFIPSHHWPAVRRAFLLYYTRQGHFIEEDDRWKDADNAELFWQLH